MRDIKETLQAILLCAVTGLAGSNALAAASLPIKSCVLNDTVWIADTTLHVEEQPEAAKIPIKPLNEIKKALRKQAPTLNKKVINVVITALKCANKNEIAHNHILTIIDYSLPANQKRLWVFDLSKNKLLFHTYISHSIKSGTLLTNRFSNKPNSKTSSLGIFVTENAYRGRHGASLKLIGIDSNFNNNAYKRFIVMHGAWYMNEKFIEKYGRPGRSWGCPALPLKVTTPIIKSIKDNALFVVYYPSAKWLAQSKFLNCDDLNNPNNVAIKANVTPPTEKKRQAILYVDVNKNNKREENEPIIVTSAENYQRIFNNKAPLKRMLRRQINNQEYIALTDAEFKKLDANHNKIIERNGKEELMTIYLVIPEVKLKRGYYATEMKIITLGKIKKVTLHGESHTLHFEKKSPATIKSDKRFIRWLGL